MTNKILLDANVIIRLLTGDNKEHYEIAQDFFLDLESGRKSAVLLDIIMAEIVYVLRSYYKHEKRYIADKLKLLSQYENLEMSNKAVVIEALNIYANKNIDFADAMLCAKKNLEGYKVMSFDRDLEKC